MNEVIHPEKVYKFIAKDASFRVSAVLATRVVDEMRSILHSYPLATVSLGRSLIGCVLMASNQKEGHTVGLYFRGNGPLGVIYAEASYDGAARAYTTNPQLQMPLKNGLLDVSGAIGHGLLEVVRGVPYTSQLFTGTVIIKTGEIGDDIAYYLEQSQQIPSVVALGVSVDSYGMVNGAGGILVELFPGAKESTIQKIEQSILKAPSLQEFVTKSKTPHDYLNEFLKGFELEELPFESRVRYECRCSQAKVEQALVLLGPGEIDDMIQDKKPVEARCDFCGRQYTVPVEELKRLRNISQKRTMN